MRPLVSRLGVSIEAGAEADTANGSLIADEAGAPGVGGCFGMIELPRTTEIVVSVLTRSSSLILSSKGGRDFADLQVSR